MVTDERNELEAVFWENGYADFKWIDPHNVVTSQWVRMKCKFGCPGYGTNASCPPNTPSVSECRQLFDEYKDAVVFHFQKDFEDPEERHAWSREVNRGLVELERQVFVRGYRKAFLLAMDSCSICTDCSGVKEECKEPKLARPTPEGMAIDVFATVRQYGLPIQVLSDFSQTMNRYAFLLIE
jgi:predicted metal-binding protein